MDASSGSSSRSTLLWGGAGIVVASILSLAPRVSLFLLPSSWGYYRWESYLGMSSTVVLVVALAILAVGLRHEPGIAGASLVGKVALIVFPVTGLALYAISLVPMATLSETDYTGTANPSPGILARVAGASWSIEVLGPVALIVASVVVFRAGVVHGVARWGLPALAVVTAAAQAAAQTALFDIGDVWQWCLAAATLIQLVTGVLYLVQAQTATPRHPLQVAAGH